MNEATQDVKPKNKLPIAPGIFKIPVSPSEKAHLIGGKCESCGTVLFPKPDICTNCGAEGVIEIALSTRGKVYASTHLTLPPPLYRGPVPYVLGYVELPEGLLIPTRFGGCCETSLPIGTEVQLTLEKSDEDQEGNEIWVYSFVPIQASVK